MTVEWVFFPLDVWYTGVSGDESGLVNVGEEGTLDGTDGHSP